METSNGLMVKFSSRGRTYTQKNFKKMPDGMLLGQVLVFAYGLPWRDHVNRQDVLKMLSIASAAIRGRENKREKSEPKEEGRKAA